MICPNCGTRLPEGSTRCHFCGYLPPQERTLAETCIIVVALFTVMLAISLLLFVVTGKMEIEYRFRAVVCLIAGAAGTWVFWKITRRLIPGLAGSR
jgi:hypothetical protein